MSHRSMTKDRTKSNALFIKHDMNADESTSEMVELAILRAGKQWPERQPIRPKIKKIITHANALVRYKNLPPNDKSSIGKRRKSLISNLDDIGVVTALASADVQLRPSSLKEELEVESIDTSTLERLLRAANAVLDNKSFGRPYEQTSFIIRTAVIAWVKADKTDRYTYNDVDGLQGNFSNFLRDLFQACNVAPPSDASIQWRLRQPVNLFDLMTEKFKDF